MAPAYQGRDELAKRQGRFDAGVTAPLVGSDFPVCSLIMYSAYHAGHSASACPMRFSCSPCADAAWRSAASSVVDDANVAAVSSTRPGKRAVISCTSQLLPSGSL